ncbi:hypothetical protein DPMN_171324 [Dreissena polymorpha]|uniref:Uncharacterized protein n=1 Tax=Dreissena polymorpha TaxID=45954 RepID=A0A9D4IDM7_DREPO|nr:hypothetical protein DPMN_171324 [Dreissena polymorpha]
MYADYGEDATVEEHDNAVFSDLLPDEQEVKAVQSFWGSRREQKRRPIGVVSSSITRIVSTSLPSG